MPIDMPNLPGRPTERPEPPAGGDPPLAGAPRGAEAVIRSIPSERWYGVYPALVRDNRDPEGLGRVRVRLPWALDAGGSAVAPKGEAYETWARVATLMAGGDRGSWFMPEIDDEVLVAFEAGHPGRPVVIGALWNGQDEPPETTDAGNTAKVLRTRGGSELRFDDHAGSETIGIQTAAGQSVRVSAEGGGTVRVTDGRGTSIVLDPSGVHVESPARVHLKGAAITLEAPVVDVRSAVLKADGVVQGRTIIADQVVASSYTPGAGNIW